MQDKYLGITPPMGWNSWNTFTWNINEDLIKETADAMVSSGLKDAGYEYVVIDDCWSLRQRDENGCLVADPEKFPHGMKAVADYVHGKGLKFGMYSCDGTHTCAGYPGSFEHEFQDAATFASWGVDYLKYDNCYKPHHINGEILYKRMSLALRNCGRDILFSACNWGSDDVWSWIQGSGAQLFRSTGDIQDSWESIKNLALSQMGKTPYSGPYCHNDIDMLVVGMYGGSNNEYIGSKLGGCTDVEYRTHFSLWALMNSPLMIGCDIRKMSEATKETLTNPELIAINQDIECRGPYVVPGHDPETLMALVKPMSDGSLAIGLFNLGDAKSEMSLQFWDMGIPVAAGMGLEMHNCWTHENEGVFTERYASQIEPHGCMVFRAKLVKAR
ncbi:glycoside hydrolase family 27 protein [Acutalibacter sp. 1XD8-33]|uniref:glycoside hydrolase family 27 protein n=1 Tax=Acutalibacter sp. 1XD8-33 TaxID=2320081 RepID=UPI000EA3F417|nr:glycoside hydrolase family 27 protein [Acutalibacter sp. 1XD8-33]RKJ41089.1 glycoside hydrolase family 27 protein [Acutalibacter sp. 1XD8-33]